MPETLLAQKREDGILVLTLNRPEAMNSMNLALVKTLKHMMEKADADPAIRVIIITGADPPPGKKAAFSVGADLVERRSMSEEDVKGFIAAIRETMISVESVRVPVIAAINGFALGGGTELALACDIRLASADAVLGLPETGLAVIPGGGGTQRLPRLVGPAKAKELIYTARRIEPGEALAIGLVNRVIEPEHLMEAALSLAGEIVANGPIAVQQAKYAINRGMEMPLQSALNLESEAYEKTIPTKDRKEALAAFAEKRKPVFRGE
ncbi:MAG: enoyl-CoA hydratase-related protein [Desulfobacterales bacterium]